MKYDEVAHLEMIQSVINRMAQSSATMKGLGGTIAAGAIALFGTSSASIWIFIAAAIPIIAFWIMDARYLQIEKAFRALYNHVRGKTVDGITVEPYSMDYRPFTRSVESWQHLLKTWSVMWFYGAILIAFISIYLATTIAAVSLTPIHTVSP